MELLPITCSCEISTIVTRSITKWYLFKFLGAVPQDLHGSDNTNGCFHSVDTYSIIIPPRHLSYNMKTLSIHVSLNTQTHTQNHHRKYTGGTVSFQWRYNERDCVSNHQPHGCLLNRLFRCRSKKTSKLRVTGLGERNSPVTGEFPAQRSSNAENVSIWWRHHVPSRIAALYPCHIVATRNRSILCSVNNSIPLTYLCRIQFCLHLCNFSGRLGLVSCVVL